VSADRYYITTAIDYANGEPHLGHAFEKIGADVMCARPSLGIMLPCTS
jgi:methionyl-tRNA synthetase